jgi:hypothetical protein
MTCKREIFHFPNQWSALSETVRSFEEKWKKREIFFLLVKGTILPTKVGNTKLPIWQEGIEKTRNFPLSKSVVGIVRNGPVF